MAYCTSLQVSYILRGMFPNTVGSPTGFTELTTPTLTQVESWITLVDSELDMALAEAGYMLPLVAITGESIPAQQTNLLTLASIMGVAGMVIDALKPAPAVGSGSRSGFPTGTRYFRDRFLEILNKIKHTAGMGIRAKTYPGTPANIKLKSHRGPMSSFREGLEGASDNMTLREFTDLVQLWNSDVKDWESWEYDTVNGFKSF